ncbi:MAG: DUF2336 domain-containing protein [Asticcacaulis sp.]
MSAGKLNLSQADIQRLVKSENADDRAVAAHKLCRVMGRSELDEADKVAAQEILRILAEDTAELVRRALAVTLRSSPVLPRDVALKLAQDVHSVALPVISFSPVFTDTDLAILVAQSEPIRQIAVAKRATLSEVVTEALSEHAVEQAVQIACANDNARFQAGSLSRVIERFPQSQTIQAAIVERSDLPVEITEKLVHVVSEALREQLITRHGLSRDVAQKVSEATRERATLTIKTQKGEEADPAALARHLHQSGRLTASFLLRALVRGRMALFEHGIAELSGVPHARTWLMIHDAGPLGLRAIYERAGLPARLYSAFRVGVDCFRTLILDGRGLEPERFEQLLIQRFLTLQPFTPREDLTYFLECLDRRLNSEVENVRDPKVNGTTPSSALEKAKAA